MPSFKNLDSAAGLKELNSYLATRSYIEGYTLSGADFAVFQQVGHNVDTEAYPHVGRWYKHVRAQPEWVSASLGGAEVKSSGKAAASPKQKAATPQQKAATPKQKVASPKQKVASPKAAPAPAAADDDDFDLLGDDDDDGAAAAAIAAKKKAEEEASKKKDKPAPVAKSSVILDVKPEGLETDMGDLEKQIRGIDKDGLTWGGHQLVPVAYGIKKLRIIATIVDDLISVDDLQEEIEAIEGVQSTDIHAFNKV